MYNFLFKFLWEHVSYQLQNFSILMEPMNQVKHGLISILGIPFFGGSQEILTAVFCGARFARKCAVCWKIETYNLHSYPCGNHSPLPIGETGPFLQMGRFCTLRVSGKYFCGYLRKYFREYFRENENIFENILGHDYYTIDSWKKQTSKIPGYSPLKGTLAWDFWCLVFSWINSTYVLE